MFVQNGGYARLRRADCLACVQMIDEYARHNGHADLIRELVDGATGPLASRSRCSRVASRLTALSSRAGPRS